MATKNRANVETILSAHLASEVIKALPPVSGVGQGGSDTGRVESNGLTVSLRHCGRSKGEIVPKSESNPWNDYVYRLHPTGGLEVCACLTGQYGHRLGGYRFYSRIRPEVARGGDTAKLRRQVSRLIAKAQIFRSLANLRERVWQACEAMSPLTEEEIAELARTEEARGKTSAYETMEAEDCWFWLQFLENLNAKREGRFPASVYPEDNL